MVKLNYKNAGVDIRKADDFVCGIKTMVKSNFALKTKAFGSLFNLAPYLKEYKKPILVSSTDGVGTKLKIAIECNLHNTIGIDLVGMNVNDVVCLGARPLFFLDYIACGKLNPNVLKTVVAGINQGLKQSNCLLIGGETAEMPGLYKKNDYDLAGFCVGIVDQDKMLNSTRIEPGDLIVGISSSGLHSNGYSLARKALGKTGIKRYFKELLVPTRIYVQPVLAVLKNLSVSSAIKGIAHITGGAFYDKATKILPSGLGMQIDSACWDKPDIFQIIQEKGKISDKEMYNVFNMGIGLMLVIKPRVSKQVLRILNQYYPAQLIGQIVQSKKNMIIE